MSLCKTAHTATDKQAVWNTPAPIYIYIYIYIYIP